jgi:hypothetical protein
MGDATDQYRRLRDRADGGGGRLVVLHEAHLACRPGCHDCCTELSVSAVEYAAILADLRAAGVTAATLPPPSRGRRARSWPAGCAGCTGSGR